MSKAEGMDDLKNIEYTEVSTQKFEIDEDETIYKKTTVSEPNLNDDNANRTFLYTAVCVANLAAYTCGLTFAWTSPEIPKLQIVDDNPLGSPITPSEESWIGSLLTIGAAIGPFAAGFIADRIGRKTTIITNIPLFIFAFVLSAYATSVYSFYVARLICGLAVGSVFTVLPMYVGEVSDDASRSTLGSFMQLFITAGLLFSYSVGPYVSIKSFNLACVVVPAVGLAVFYMYIPESPYYLLRKNDVKGAEMALISLRSKSRTKIQKELLQIKESVEKSLSNKAGFMDIFKSKPLINAFILSNGLVAFQQLTGVNVVIFYAQNIFADAGSSLAPEICTILIGLVQVASSFVTPVLVGKKGKIFCLLLSSAFMTISHFVLAYFFYLKEQEKDVSSIGMVPVVSLICYIAAFCLGFGPLPWAVMSELFPGNVKSIASTITASTCWFLGFIVTKYFVVLVAAVGQSGAFGIFGLFCFGAGVFVYMRLPNTEGKSLQEIQELLAK